MHTTNETFYNIFGGTYVVQLGRLSHHVSADKAYSDLLRHVTTLFATLDFRKPFQDSLAALIIDGLAVTVLHVVNMPSAPLAIETYIFTSLPWRTERRPTWAHRTRAAGRSGLRRPGRRPNRLDARES